MKNVEVISKRIMQKNLSIIKIYFQEDEYFGDLFYLLSLFCKKVKHTITIDKTREIFIEGEDQRFFNLHFRSQRMLWYPSLLEIESGDLRKIEDAIERARIREKYSLQKESPVETSVFIEMKQSTLACVYCREVISGVHFSCSSCKSVFHVDCSSEFGNNCPTTGCSYSKTKKEKVHA